jgi:hypothetical protein
LNLLLEGDGAEKGLESRVIKGENSKAKLYADLQGRLSNPEGLWILMFGHLFEAPFLLDGGGA